MINLINEFRKIENEFRSFEKEIFLAQKSLHETRKKHACLKSELNNISNESKRVEIERELSVVTEHMYSQTKEINVNGKKLNIIKSDLIRLKHFFNVCMTKKDTNSLLEYKFYLDRYKEKVIHYLH